MSRRPYVETRTSADDLIDAFPFVPAINDDDTTLNTINSANDVHTITLPVAHISAITRGAKRRERLLPSVEPSARDAISNQTFTKADIQREQKRDADIAPIVNFLRYGNLPSDTKAARAILPHNKS